MAYSESIIGRAGCAMGEVLLIPLGVGEAFTTGYYTLCLVLRFDAM